MSYGFTERLRGENASVWPMVAAIVAAVSFLYVLPYGIPFVWGGLGGFQISLLTETLVFVLFATAFNLLYGYTGLLSFGHAMFIAVAGYTVAKSVSVLAPALNISGTFGGASPLVTWALAIVLGVVMATVLAVVVGYLSVRLTEIYFALITLAFSMAIFSVFLQDTIGQLQAALGITEDNVFSNGSDGLTFILGQVDLFGWQFQMVDILNPLAYYFLTLAVVSVGLYALWRIVRSPFGVVCQAIRENPERARALGIDVTRHQWLTFIISGAFSGLAGAILIPKATNVNPEAHALWTASAEPVIMTVIGGPYSFLGPALGAFSYEYLRWLITLVPALEQYWQFSFGVLLLLVVMFLDNGVAGGVNRAIAWLATARTRYQEGGAGAVLSFAEETVVGYVRLFFSTVREKVAGAVRRLKRLGGSDPDALE